MSNIWLLAIIVIPAIIILLLKINAVMVYLGLCLGYVLSQLDGANPIITKIEQLKLVKHWGGSNDIRLLLLLLPTILIGLFMLRSAKGSKLSLNSLIAIAAGFLTVIIVVPQLPSSTAANLITSSLWQDIIKFQGTIIGISVVIVLLSLIIQHSKIGSLSKGLKHHKSKD